MDRLTDKSRYCFMVCESEPDKPAGWSAEKDCKLYDNCYNRKLYDKLQQYEDAEEQGLLKRLPCKVGATIYRIYTGSHIEEDRVESFALMSYGLVYVDQNGRETKVDKFGRHVFVTKPEAENALDLINKRTHKTQI